MTLVVGWVRSTGDVRELVVAADSRLSGTGSTWDCAPKILMLPRTDAVIGFAGVTDVAYPSMLQVLNAITANPASVERRYDITQLASRVEDVLNQMLDIRVSGRGLSEEARKDNRHTQFVLGGWSWRYQRFELWEYRFGIRREDGPNGSFKRRHHPARSRGRERAQVVCIGDAGAHALETLISRTAGSKSSLPRTLDMEPLEVLRDVIRSGQYPTVGGAPQVAKVYRHMNSETFGVTWRSKLGEPDLATFAGRPLLEYEKPFFSFIDPDDPTRHAKRS